MGEACGSSAHKSVVELTMCDLYETWYESLTFTARARAEAISTFAHRRGSARVWCALLYRRKRHATQRSGRHVRSARARGYSFGARSTAAQLVDARIRGH